MAKAVDKPKVDTPVDSDEPRLNRKGVGGRPPMFETPEALAEAIDDYFKNGVNLRKVILGPPNKRYVDTIPVPTITGLVNYIGFSDRASFYDYEKKAEFTHTIKRARTFIEQEYEEQLQTGNAAGAIFALKNFGWVDKYEQALTNPDGSLNPYGQLTTDELRELLKKGGDANSN